MTVKEMILKFNLELAKKKDGEVGVRIQKKPTAKEMEMLKAAKEEIMIELRRQQEENEKRIEKMKKEAEEKRVAEKEAILNGEKPLIIEYHDGEYLSGYTAYGVSREILEELKIGEVVYSWGLLISDEEMKALGKEKFSFSEVFPVPYEKVRTLAEKKAKIRAEKNAKKEAEKAAKFAKAKETGKPVLLEKWTTDCCDPNESCDIDVHYKYAMPDGSTKHQWVHTW